YEPPQASALLKLFPAEIRNEVVLRVALLEKVQPAMSIKRSLRQDETFLEWVLVRWQVL
ncbi:MAG: hypothetical protein EBX53_08835, partial [Betaproteobacteria bacterium]|nr:hypothetical protein [Betaproteobacteria bacterium]